MLLPTTKILEQGKEIIAERIDQLEDGELDHPLAKTNPELLDAIDRAIVNRGKAWEIKQSINERHGSVFEVADTKEEYVIERGLHSVENDAISVENTMPQRYNELVEELDKIKSLKGTPFEFKVSTSSDSSPKSEFYVVSDLATEAKKERMALENGFRVDFKMDDPKGDGPVADWTLDIADLNHTPLCTLTGVMSGEDGAIHDAIIDLELDKYVEHIGGAEYSGFDIDNPSRGVEESSLESLAVNLAYRIMPEEYIIAGDNPRPKELYGHDIELDIDHAASIEFINSDRWVNQAVSDLSEEDTLLIERVQDTLAEWERDNDFAMYPEAGHLDAMLEEEESFKEELVPF